MNHRFVNLQKLANRFSFGWITPALMLLSLAGSLQAQQISLVTTTITLSVVGCSGSCVANVSQSVSLQAAVTQGGNSVGNVGTVAFLSNTKILGVAPVSSGTATLATTTIPGGTTSLRAIYLANGTFGSSKSSAVSIAVSARGGNGFATATSYGSGGTNPSLMALADVSGDGIADMVVAHSGGTPSSVGVLKGNGSGGFAAVQNFSVGDGANSVAVGDFNSDGKVDIAVTNGGSSNFSILLNTSPNASTLSFATAVNYAAGLNPQTIAVGDFNGDGIPDLALTNFIPQVTVNVYFGVGNGTFPGSPSLALTGPNTYATALEAGDFNGDGNADLAVATGGNLVVFLNTGSGAFGSANTFASAAITNPVSLAIADYNRDGKADVALTNYQPSPNGTVVVLLNNTGEVFSFGPATTYTIGANPWGVAAGDFTGDGNLDLAAVNLANDNVNLLLGSAAGSFTVAGTVAVGSFPKGLAVGDLNADGVLDFATANFGSGVSVLLGVGTTTTSLTSSVNPTNFGQSTTLTATVAPSTATGTVTFKDGATTIGSATLSAGTATMSTSSLTSGAHSLTAVYGGNTTNGTSTSGVVSQTVRTAVVISTTTLTPARQGSAYSVSLGVSGGTGPYTWTVSAGALPAGLTLSAAGLLSGTPTVNGNFSFSATATDSLGGAGIQSLSLIVNTVNSVFNGQQVQVTWHYPDLSSIYQAPQTATVGAGLEFSNYALANPTFDIDFSDTTIQINSSRNGSQFDPNQPFNGLVITNPGGLPPFTNVTITATNWTDISSAVFDSSRITFDATHIYLNFKGMLNQIGMGLTLQVNGIGLPTTIPGSSVGFPYSTQLTTTGGTGAGRVYALTSGTLPTGLALNTSTGVISGVPTTAGTFTPTIQVTDSGSNTASQAYSAVIRQAGLLNTRWQGNPATTYTGPGVIGTGSDSWNLFITASGSGTLNDNANQATPVSLTWSADTTVIAAPFNSNAFCYPSPNSFCALMGNYLAKQSGATGNITFGNLPANSNWDIFLYQQAEDNITGRQISITANGVTAATTVPNSTNDSSFILNKNYLVTSATTNGSGQLSINFQGTAGDLEGNINGLQLRPHLNPLSVTQTTIPAGTVGTVYSTTLTPSGGTGVGNTWVIFSEVGPPGLTLSSGGVLSGIPSIAGSFNFDVRVTDSQGSVAFRTLTLLANPAVSVTTTSLPPATNGVAYSQTLAASGGSGSYTWTITTGTLPTGLSLNPSTGVISGTPSVAGTQNLTFRATDAGSSFGTSSSIALTVLQTSTVTLTTSATPSTFGTSITLTASIVPGSATGTVFFFDGFSVIGKRTLTSGSATLATRLLGTGPHKLQAFYKGDSAVARNVSSGLPQAVNSTAQDRVNSGVRYASGTSPWGVATGDFNLDGKTDIVAVNNGSGNVSVYLGTGNTYPGASPTNFAVGTNPMHVAVGDFDGDGKPDLAVTNNGSNNISVLLGDGTGNFAAAVNYAVGTAPKGIVATDFDGDGVLDLAVANSGGPNLMILTGSGAGTFASSATYFAGAAPSGLVVADFNGDGYPDVAVTNPTSATVSILLGASNGTLGSAVSIGTGGAGPEGIVTADFNGDGKADLAVTNSVGNNLGVFLGTGSGTFGIVSNMALNSGPAFLSTGDFNGDGIVDLAIPQTGFAVWLLTGNGTGGFTIIDTIGSASRATALADFNGDGRTDLVYTDTAGSAIGVHLGLTPAPIVITSSANPAVSGQTITLTATVPSLATGNIQFYDNGTPLGSAVSLVSGVATLSASFTTGSHSITAIYFGDATYHNNNSNTLPLQVLDPVTVSTTSLPTGVLGAAYNFTLAATGGSGSYTWAITSGAIHGGLSLNTATGAITGTPIQTGNPTVVFRATDSNGFFGARQFTLTVNPGVSVTTSTLPGGAIGTAYNQTLAATGGLGGYTWTITSGALQAGLSLNSATGAITGTPTAGGTSTITFRATDTGGNFAASTIALTVATATTTSLTSSLASPSAFSAALSLTATVSPASTGKVTFYDGSAVVGIGTLSGGTATISARLLGTGTHALRAYYQGSALGLPSTSTGIVQVVNSKPQSGFAAGVGYTPGTGPSLGASADFNNDGKADYAVANYGASNISVFLGDGLGSLGTATNVTVGLNPFSLTTGDFNGDGNVDIATANLFADSISVLLGNGLGGFAAGVTYTAGVGVHPGQIIAGDFNRDGFVDLATANYNTNNISVLFGAGNGTFGTGVLYTVGTNPSALAAGDFNNDGIADLAVGNQTTNNVSILLGQGGGVFTAAVNYPAGGTTLQSVTTADFNADGNLDLVVTNSGTSTVTLLAGTGSGTFGAASVIGSSNGPTIPVVGDFNGNGVPDVAVTNDTGSNVSVLIGSGSLTFATPANYALAPGASGARGITVTDLNGDGVSDLVVASPTSNGISVLLGVGTTTTTLTSSANPSNLGAGTTLTATVSPATATGTVTFKDGAATLGTGTLSGGVATFAASFATAGVHSLTAVYAGNATNATSTSSALTQNVNQGTTTTSISSQTNPSTFAGTATFTATVAPSTAVGTVTFRLGGLTLGTGTLSGGTASFSTTTLAAGSYSVDAVYGGDSNYLTSTSGTVTQMVNARATTTSLSSSTNPATSGQNVTLTATVTPSSTTGSVTFKDGAATLGSGSITSGVATFGTTSLAVGSHSLTAVYDGDGNNATSASSAVNQTVNAPLVITTSSLPYAVQNIAYNQTLTATGGSGAKTWAITSGTLPSGLTLNPATGVISGTAASATTANITVRAADTGNNFATASLSLQVLPPVTITTLTLPEGVRNFAYSQNGLTIVATGATNVYTFDVSAGTLPTGLTLSPSGLLAGTPSFAGTTGTFTFTVRVTDASTSQATQQYTLVINASLVVSTVTLPGATQGTSYSQTLTATGGVLPLTWAILPTSTAIQAGFTLNPTTGLLTGTPNTFGKLYIDIQLQDFAGNATTRSLILIIARNGTSTTDFAVSGSSKIVRMSAIGTNILTVCTGVNCHANDLAADPQGNIYSHDTTGIYKITPGGIVTTLLARPGGGVGGLAVDGSGNIIFVDNRSDEIYRVTPTGVLTIVAAFPDASTLELQDAFVAIDSGGNYIVGSDAGSTMRIYRFTPAGAVTTLATWSGKGVTGLAIGSDGKIAFGDFRNIQLVVFDPAGSPNNQVTYNIPQGEGTLPRGLAIDPANGHYVVPEQYSNSLFRITPGGAITEMFQGPPLAAPTSIAAIPALAAPVISTVSLPNGLAGQNYGSFQLVATGGTGNFTWTATGLPPGLTMSTGGVISGGPSGAGTFQINITITDVLTGLTAAKLIPLTIASPIAPVTISSSSSQANIALGGTVSASFAAGGGVPPYTFSASGLPQGVSLNGLGSLSGSPASPGNSTATIFVSDTSGRSASTSFSITVLGILISSLPNGTTGIPYSATIGALGGVQPYNFAANGLPNGLGINAQGTIAGTPTVGGTFSVSVTVSDGAGARISAGGSITIVVPGAPVSIPSGSLPDATVGVPYSASLSAIGGKTPYSWSVLSGSLPDGLSFGANGIVSGTPTAPGGGGFAALVTDSSGGTASTGASITVKPAPIVITSKSPLASGMLGVEYPSVQLAATGGIAPYKWAVSGGAFPAGVTLDSGGTISGTPTAAGDFTATVTVTDAAGTAGSGGFSVTIRQISADLILSSATAAFELTTGAVALPSGLAIGVQSTVVAQQISFAVVTSPAVPWLTVTNGNKTPDRISVVLSNGALSLPAGDYSTTLKVTCSTGSCSGSAQSVAVTLKVTSPPARLRVVTDILSFTTTSQNLAPISQTIAIQNAGGGSLGVASISCGAPWCSVGAPPAALAGGSSANIPITVNPAAVSSGYYRTTVEIATSGGKGSVPVTLFIAQNSSMTLSPSGGQFGMPQGGAPGNPSGAVLVSVNSASAVTFTASQLPGADWLKVGTSSVSVSSAQPGTISYSIDTAAAGRLTQGTYYGQISVGGPGIVNAPQTYQVILNVTPPGDVARPDPQPAGLLFLTTIGGANPPPQIVTVFTSSTRAVQFQASATSDGGWLAVSPGLGTTSQPSPAGTNATVNIAGLKQGVYTGLISYAFAGNAVRSVNVTLVVAPVGGTAATLTSSTGTPSVSAPLQPRATCTATSLAAVQTGIVSNFSAPAAWPTPLSLRIVDDCGGTVTGAQIVSTFSNGDPPLPLPLVDSKNGVYAGTWTPRKQSATLTISARITAKGYKDLSMQLIGAVTPNAAPLLTPNGTVHAFSPLVGAPLAPGNIVAVYGSNLAVLTGVPAAVPLPTSVNGTQVLIGGIKAPLYFTSPGQVNAQIPYELEPNKQYQVIISANGALSTPDAIQLTNVVPGLAAYADGTVIAQHADGSLITAKSPAKGGEVAIAYLSGLGATDNNPASGGAAPGDILARPNSLPTLAIGGKDAKIAFVGLTPGLVGLYQMNFEVPEGLDAGNPRITVTQEGNSSNPVLLPYVPK